MKKLIIALGVVSIIFACNSGTGEKQAGDASQGADTPGTTGPSTAIANERGLELIGASDCTTCHDINAKKIGPAYVDVANKYENTPAVVDTLVNKIIHGGSGNWGAVAMTPHPDMSREDAKEMVNYIMTLKNQ